jgi:hypothetical protein
MTTRDFALELIDGPFVAIPPPDYITIKVMKAEVTKGGIHIPELSFDMNGALPMEGKPQDKIPPIGEVVEVGCVANEQWRDVELPWRVGDIVKFHPGLGPIGQVTGDFMNVPFGCVTAIIRTKARIDYEEPNAWDEVYRHGQNGTPFPNDPPEKATTIEMG